MIGNCRYFLKRPVKRPPRHVERLRYRVMVFPLLNQLLGMSDLLRREKRLAAHLHTTGDRRQAARRGAFLNQRPFEFRQDSHHLPHGATRGRGGVNRFRQRPESHPSRFQIVQEADQIPQRPPQPVQLPDRERIAFRQGLEALGQLRPLDVRPRGFVSKDAVAPRLLQGGNLQIGVLVFRGDPCITEIHGLLLSLIYGTTKPLIYQGWKLVSKLF